MAIRTELLNPTVHVFSADTYIKIVSEHGTIMMIWRRRSSWARSVTTSYR